MRSNTKKTLNNVLATIILIVLTTASFFIIRYILGVVFGWFGDEDNISWKSILITCAILSIVALIAKIITERRCLEGAWYKIIDAVFKIALYTTMFFGCFILLTDAAEVADKTMHWLTLSISLGIFNTLYAERMRRESENDENMLVVAAECHDIPSAEAIVATLEAGGIQAMIVEKHSPIYIKGSDAPAQVQVCRKDLNTAKHLLAK